MSPYSIHNFRETFCLKIINFIYYFSNLLKSLSFQSRLEVHYYNSERIIAKIANDIKYLMKSMISNQIGNIQLLRNMKYSDLKFRYYPEQISLRLYRRAAFLKDDIITSYNLNIEEINHVNFKNKQSFINT